MGLGRKKKERGEKSGKKAMENHKGGREERKQNKSNNSRKETIYKMSKKTNDNRDMMRDYFGGSGRGNK